MVSFLVLVAVIMRISRLGYDAVYFGKSVPKIRKFLPLQQQCIPITLHDVTSHKTVTLNKTLKRYDSAYKRQMKDRNIYFDVNET
jgi:hypothetical protein